MAEVNSATSLLLSPRRRARFDNTGETQDVSLEQEIVAYLAVRFKEVIQMVNLSLDVDLPYLLEQKVDNEIECTYVKIEEIQRLIQRADIIIRRLKKKKKHRNKGPFIPQILDVHRRALLADLEMLQHEIEIRNGVKEALNDYRWSL